MKKFKALYPDMSLKQFIRKMKRSGKYIGMGSEAEVFGIPGMDDYVLRVAKNVSTGWFRKVPPLKKL